MEDIFGIDGFYVRRELLEIPPEKFVAHDLQEPFRLDRIFDLVVSLEVAEHLPKESAAGFVESLTRLAPVVLFSAAIPFQGGEGHLNEQWPEYWARLFEARGYAPVDCLRRRVWQSPNVSWYYAQNVLIYVRPCDPRCNLVIASSNSRPILVNLATNAQAGNTGADDRQSEFS
jgi:hypothetical protein